MAQFSDQRLIPLVVDEVPPNNPCPGKYNRAAVAAPITENPNTGFRDNPASFINAATDSEFPAHGFAVYGRAPRGYPVNGERDPDTYDGAGSAEAGILHHVPYGAIRHALLREGPSPTRMPDLEAFFDFGGTLELITTGDSPLAMRDIVISEIMWAVDRGIDNSPDGGGIMVPNPDFNSDFL